MSAVILTVPGKGELIAASSCDRTIPVFDGRARFDLTLSFKRFETSRLRRGYKGPLLVCMVRYKAIAGHRTDRSQVKYVEDTNKIEVWFAPVAGTRVLVPYKVSVPTQIGAAVIEANSLITEFPKQAQADKIEDLSQQDITSAIRSD
jgi:hypothetical protein